VVYKSVVPGVAVAVSVPAIQAEDSRQPRQSVVSSAARN
jgi:hypothetical protein